MKKGSFSPVQGLILALIAAVAIFFLLKIVVEVISNPYSLSQEGSKCHFSIEAATTINELTAGLKNKKPNCQVIQKQVPLKDSYDEVGKSVSKMNAAEFHDVIERDFTELIARTWWISAEGKRSSALTAWFSKHYISKNQCLIIYSVRVHAPTTSSFKPDEFKPLSYGDISNGMNRYKKSEIFNQDVNKDSTIAQYLATTGKGAGVILVRQDGSVYKSGTIDIEQDSADAIYGIAVGFDQISSIRSFFTGLWEDLPQSMSDDSSYILIAPYEQLTSYCAVQNE